MATNNGGDKGTRNLVIIMVSFIVVVGVVFSLITNRSSYVGCNSGIGIC
jgi:hypothetical protein